MANSVGPDEAAPLIWVRTICSELFITIITFLGNKYQVLLSKALVYIYIYIYIKKKRIYMYKNNGDIYI